MPPAALQLAVALGLGLLVGLQRQRSESAIGGIRTFPLITVSGTLAALLAQSFGGWVVAAGFGVCAVLLASANWVRLRSGEADPGQTTEFAAVVMYGIGAWLVVGEMPVAIALGGLVAVLLQLRGFLHAWVEKVGDGDFRAVMQLVVIALVILPILPNRAMGPYGVLNPYEIWWMVILIVGLSFVGYLAFKLFGARAGAALGGVLGGMISSTATTASYARRSKEAPETSRLGALVVMIASTVVFGRVLVEIAAVAPRHFVELAPPLVAMLGVGLVLSLAVWRSSREGVPNLPDAQNPADLKAALLFGALYAFVLLAVAFARDRFGAAGVYGVAALSGLTDMDALTLSTARLVDSGRLAPADGSRAILLGGLANLVFKGGIVAFLGSPALRSRIAVLFGLALAAGGAIWVFLA
jgi:uncharacterized membrane protein (DUF4010 family)